MTEQSPYIEKNVIVKLTFDFALEVIAYAEMLSVMKKFIIGDQLLKSATSIGANIREAQNAESKADFIHKMKISAKEAEETEYWLLLCEHAKNYPAPEGLLLKLTEIKKILNKIIATSKQNLSKRLFLQFIFYFFCYSKCFIYFRTFAN